MEAIEDIGFWSEIKLDIIGKYAQAYSHILSTRTAPRFYHAYIDAFAGPGLHRSRTTGRFVPGSPLRALSVDPPFREYHFIDLDRRKVKSLMRIAQESPNVHVYEGDCNSVLLDDVFPKVRWEDYRRALCLLDPYGLHLQWEVIRRAGQMRSIEIFLNFPIHDMNRNVLWQNPDGVSAAQATRMSAYWGDDSWRQAAYDTRQSLFEFPVKTGIRAVVGAFRKRLRDVAGFKYVPEPLPFRNNRDALLYYLFFASQQPVAADIVEDIFSKHRKRGIR